MRNIVTSIVISLLWLGSVSADLLNGAEAVDAAKAVQQKVGQEVKALEVVVYPERALFQLQDPTKPENVDQYTYSSGGLGAPAPVKLFGGGKIDDNVFAIKDINFSAIAALVEEAKGKIQIEGAKVTHAIIKRNLPFSRDIQIRVFVNGTRKNGYLDADASGKVKKVTTS